MRKTPISDADMSLFKSTFPHPGFEKSTALLSPGKCEGNTLNGLTVRINDACSLDRGFNLLKQIGKTSRASVFQTDGWMRSVAEAALSKAGFEVRILLALDHTRPVAALPLCLDKRTGFKIARILGAPLSQYGDLLCEDSYLAGATPVLEFELATLRDVDLFIFSRVRDDAGIVTLLSALHAERFSESAAPYADLTKFNGFDEYLKGNWKAHRDRRRLRRRSMASGPLTFEVCSSPSRAAELTKQAIDLKRRWLPGVHRWFGTLASDQWCGALLNAINFPDTSTQPVVTALHSRDKLAAIEIGFVHGQRYSAFLGAFDPFFRDWSPTQLLMEDTVAWCFRNKIEVYDLLPPDDRYKERWTTDKMPVADWIVSRSIKGRLYAEFFEKGLNRFIRRSSPHVQRLLKSGLRKFGEAPVDL
jgi:CelD/BcsL family acetyltransferase involved in cellulose biosynthesis